MLNHFYALFFRIMTALILLLAFCLPHAAFSQSGGGPAARPGELKFEHLGIAQGLSSSEVYAVIQDSKGFL